MSGIVPPSAPPSEICLFYVSQQMSELIFVFGFLICTMAGLTSFLMGTVSLFLFYSDFFPLRYYFTVYTGVFKACLEPKVVVVKKNPLLANLPALELQPALIIHPFSHVPF